MKEQLDLISALADVVAHGQLHLRRHCDCEQFSLACVKCESRLVAIHSLDLVADLREQMGVVAGDLADAARLLEAVMDGDAGDCFECQDLRSEILARHDQ